MSRGSNLKRKQKRKSLNPSNSEEISENSFNSSYVAVEIHGWKEENRNQWSELNAAKVISEIFDEVHELNNSLIAEVLSIGKSNIEAIVLEDVEQVLDLYKTADEEFNKNVHWITRTFINSALAPPSRDAELFDRVNSFIDLLDFTRASLSAMVTKIKTGENTVWQIDV